jgi:DNA-binding transcriptional ArsR family regulator
MAEPASFDLLFKALADRSRRRILDLVKERPGCNLNQLCEGFDMTRIGVMKHLEILERAGLIHSEKVGREKKLYVNAVPLQMIADRWVSDYGKLWARQLQELKARIESRGHRR